MENTESTKAAEDIGKIENAIHSLALETVRLSDILSNTEGVIERADSRYYAALEMIKSFETLVSLVAPNIWQMVISSAKRCNDGVNRQLGAATLLPEVEQDAAIETIFVNLHGRSDAHKAELRARFKQADAAAQTKPARNPLADASATPKPKHPAEKEFLQSVDELVKGLKSQTTKEAVIKEAKDAFEANDTPFKRCQILTIMAEEARDAKELSEDNYATIMAILMRTIILGSINELKKD